MFLQATMMLQWSTLALSEERCNDWVILTRSSSVEFRRWLDRQNSFTPRSLRSALFLVPILFGRHLPLSKVLVLFHRCSCSVMKKTSLQVMWCSCDVVTLICIIGMKTSIRVKIEGTKLREKELWKKQEKSKKAMHSLISADVVPKDCRPIST